MTTKTAKATRRFARTPNPQLSTAGDDARKQVAPQEAEGGSELIAAIPTPRPESKIARVTRLLERTEGASLAELVTATGWLPHTTRAALTGLKKKGKVIAKGKRDDVTCYFIAEPGA